MIVSCALYGTYSSILFLSSFRAHGLYFGNELPGTLTVHEIDGTEITCFLCLNPSSIEPNPRPHASRAHNFATAVRREAPVARGGGRYRVDSLCSRLSQKYRTYDRTSNSFGRKKNMWLILHGGERTL